MLKLIRNTGTPVESYFTLSPRDIKGAVEATKALSCTGAYVYYLRFYAKRNNIVIYKVGFTTDYPARLRSLAKEYPNYYIEEVTKLWFGNKVVAYAIEQKLHRYFSKFKHPCTIRHKELYSVDVFNPEIHASESFRAALTQLISVKNHAIRTDSTAYQIADMRALHVSPNKKRA